MASSRTVSNLFHFAGANAAVFFIAACIALCVSSCAPQTEPPDYDLYENMRSYAEQKLTDAGALPRDDFPDLFSSEYIIELTGLFRLVFGAPQLEVHLASYESDSLAHGSLSQFEVPPDSENYTDFAFSYRPAADIRAPLLHGDALKAMGGSDGSFSMDFYNLNSAEIDLETFFGDEIEKINQALDLVEPYQRQGEDRGKYIEHLKEYTTMQYRIEIDEGYIPDETEEAREAYYEAALAAYKLFMDAYFARLAALDPEQDDGLIQGSKQGFDAFLSTLYENDFAASMGKELFGDDFDTYYFEGFWRKDYYGDGL